MVYSELQEEIPAAVLLDSLILLSLYQCFYSFSSPFLLDYSTYSQAAAQQG